MKRSSGTDQLTYQLSRIADALDRIANRIIAKAMRGQRDVPSPPQRESKGIAHSMLGR